jgi:hypothetical protein
MTPTEVVAITGATSTVLVAISGFAFNWFTGERARRHEAAVRRADRAYDDRKEAYRAILRLTGAIYEVVLLTEPLWAPSAAQPP